MLDTSNDIHEGYELISPEGYSRKASLKKDTYFKLESTKPIRNFIKPSVHTFTQDISLRAVAKNSTEVGQFIEESLAELGFSHLNVTNSLKSSAELMFGRFNINRLNCRMDLTYSNKCKKFHIDRVYIRSITTLMGPGTELKFTNEPNSIYQVQAGDQLLLKGSLFPEYDLSVLHRSPKIAALGLRRLVFVMDY